MSTPTISTSTSSNWIDHVRARPLSEIALAIGLERVHGRALSPCPACEADRRGRDDGRGPVGVRPDGLGWRCHRCGVGGDGVALVALHVTGEARPRGKDAWIRIRTWCEARGWLTGEVRPARPRRSPPSSPKRVPPTEVAWLWDRCARVLDDTPVCRWLCSRAINPIPVEDLDVARALLLDQPKITRWARFRGRSWRHTGHRLLVPLFDAAGTLASLQARSIEPDTKPGEKAANPAGAQVAGLVFAEGLAQQLIQKDPIGSR